MLQWYGATSEVPWLFLLSAWVVAVIAVGAGYAYWNRRGLRLSLVARSVRPAAGSPLEDLPEQVLRMAPAPAVIFEGDALELAVGLDTSGAARGPAAVSGRVGGQRLELGTGVVPRSGWRTSVDIASVRRGPLGAEAWEVSSSDFLGLFRGARRCPDVEVALVLPRFASLAERRDVRELEASFAAPRSGGGSEPFGVREHRPGDSLRRIHWRSSARRGELIVREYEPPGMEALTLCLDPAPPSAEVADQIARIAASEAWDCIREGGRVRLWPAPPSRDLWSILESLARYPDAGAGAAREAPGRGEGVVVAITAGDADTIENAARVWIVGDAAVDSESDAPVRRVGTAWPL